MVELLALKQGLELILDQSLTPLEATQVIHMISNISCYNSLIVEYRLLTRRKDNPVVKHNFKEQNQIANQLKNVLFCRTNL